MKPCKLFLNYAGHCLAKASHAVKGDPHMDIAFRAMYGLIEHPEKGWILFDTGYTQRFFRATRFFPNKLYALITKVFIPEEEELKNQLLRAGIQPKDIRHIIVSHFHADHIGGLKDFPEAKLYCSEIAWKQVQNTPRLLAFSKGILHHLIPDDFEKRVVFVEQSVQRQDAVLGTVFDLFGDDSLQVFSVPGHAAGQIGIRLQTEKNTCLLVADACWDRRAYQHLQLPHPLVRLFFDSWADYKAGIFRLRKYHQAFPDHLIIPTHCFSSWEKHISPNLREDVV